MSSEQEKNPVSLKVYLASPAEKVFKFLATDAGRAAFWAESAVEKEGVIHFRFSNGMAHSGKILVSDPPNRFAVTYFGGSTAAFLLEPDDRGGTVVTLTETDIPAAWQAEHRAGWVTVLLTLKATVDFGVDLRNSDPARSWASGFADV